MKHKKAWRSTHSWSKSDNIWLIWLVYQHISVKNEIKFHYNEHFWQLVCHIRDIFSWTLSQCILGLHPLQSILAILPYKCAERHLITALHCRQAFNTLFISLMQPGTSCSVLHVSCLCVSFRVSSIVFPSSWKRWRGPGTILQLLEKREGSRTRDQEKRRRHQ